MSCEGEQAYYVTSYEVEVDEVTAQPRCLVGFSCGKDKEIVSRDFLSYYKYLTYVTY